MKQPPYTGPSKGKRPLTPARRRKAIIGGALLGPHLCLMLGIAAGLHATRSANTWLVTLVIFYGLGLVAGPAIALSIEASNKTRREKRQEVVDGIVCVSIILVVRLLQSVAWQRVDVEDNFLVGAVWEICWLPLVLIYDFAARKMRQRKTLPDISHLLRGES